MDLEVFEQRVAGDRDALGRSGPGQAVTIFGEAESLWRGWPLADLGFEPFAWFGIHRLQAFRLIAAEDRIEAAPEFGRYSALCPGLERLVGEHRCGSGAGSWCSPCTGPATEPALDAYERRWCGGQPVRSGVHVSGMFVKDGSDGGV